MKTKILSRLAAFMSALLFGVGAHAAVGDTFDDTTLKLHFTVLTEDEATKTGTVSVEAISQDDKITGELDLNHPVEYDGYTYVITQISKSGIFFGFEDQTEITKVILPDGLSFDSDLSRVFEGCTGITEFVATAESELFKTIDGVVYSKDGTTLYWVPGAWTSYTMPDEVTHVADCSLSDLPNLTSLTLSKNLESLGEYCLTNVFNLDFGDVLEMPETFSYMGMCAFGSFNVKKIIFNSKFTNLPWHAMNCLSETEEIEFRGDINNISGTYFEHCPKLTKLILSGITKVPSIEGNNKFMGITVPANVTVYVPNDLVDDFKADAAWSAFGVNFATLLPTVAVSVGAEGGATYVATDNLDFSKVTGLKAYRVTGTAASPKLTLNEATQVEKGEPLLLLADKATTVNVPVIDSYTGGTHENRLYAVKKDYSGGFGNTSYINGWGKCYNYILNKIDGKLAFYLANWQPVAAGKAVLKIAVEEGGEGAKMMSWDGTATAIESVATESNNAPAVYYNLSGQRVSKPTRGIYVVNGKKVIIK